MKETLARLHELAADDIDALVEQAAREGIMAIVKRLTDSGVVEGDNVLEVVTELYFGHLVEDIWMVLESADEYDPKGEK